VTVTTVEHAADIAQGQDPLTGGKVENGFGFDCFFGAVDALAIVQCNEPAPTVSAHLAEPYLAFLDDTVAWGKMTLHGTPGKYFFQFCRAAFQGPVFIFCSVHLSLLITEVAINSIGLKSRGEAILPPCRAVMFLISKRMKRSSIHSS
jgi:hypothetical protein